MTVVEFLTARLDEDQQAAERVEAAQRTWSWRPDPQHPTYEGEIPEIFLMACNTTAPGYVQFEAGEHIARQSPAHVLADVAAKRAVVRNAKMAIEWSDEQPEANPNKERVDGAATSYEAVLELLASVYSSHPDYDESWAV